MICPNCSTENKLGRKFCGECGTNLESVCAACGSSNDPDDKFCGNCGTALAAGTAPGSAIAEAVPDPEAPTQAERRLVTVLFTDLVGFTPFSEDRDPEEVRSLLTNYFDRSRATVERFGGTVDKFIGDAVMAVWGATRALEDDAERAVRAALELVDMVASLGEEIGIELRLRAGVLTGEASVGPGGNAKGLVVGDLVNTASRLQSLAAPGTVFVGDSTRALTERAIDFKDLGEHEVKGKSETVRAWRALRVSSGRGGAWPSRGLEPPFVARENEMRLLKDALHATEREGRARLVSIVGEAGIGKSRLVWELQKYIDGLAANIYWHQGRSPSYGGGLPMWAVGEMVRSRAGIAETDDDLRSRTKLRTAVAEYVADPEDQAWIEPRLAGLLGLEPMPEGARSELFAALRLFFQRIADRGVTVLVFEDIHWADEGVRDFVEELVERSQHDALLVVTVARPELLEKHPGWGSGRHNFLATHLGPLVDDDMAQLVTGMAPGIPDPVAEQITARANGVPLYAVEMVRMLITEGDLVRDGEAYRATSDLSTLAVPDSLQSAVSARLDRLTDEERKLVQVTSVLGQSFTRDGLEVIVDDPDRLDDLVASLVRKEVFVYNDDPRSPERGQYSFVQALTREVAYSRLTLGERKSAHVQVAEYFTAVDELELSGAVAVHYMAARDAASTDDDRAALSEAAQSALNEAIGRAAALHSNLQVLELVAQALNIAMTDEDRVPLWERAARASNELGDVEESVRWAQLVFDQRRTGSDPAATAQATSLLADVLIAGWRPEEAGTILEPIVAELPNRDEEPYVEAVAQLARVRMMTGASNEGAQLADSVLGAAERLEDPRLLVELLNTRGTCLANAGRLQEARVLIAGAVELAREHGMGDALLRAHNNLNYVLAFIDPTQELAAATGALADAIRLGHQGWETRLRLVLAWLLEADGDYETAKVTREEGRLLEMGPFEERWYQIADLNLQAVQGDTGAGRECIELLAEFAASTDRQLTTLAHQSRAHAYLLVGEPELALQDLHTVRGNTDYQQTLLLLFACAAFVLRDVEVAQSAVELRESAYPSRWGRTMTATAEAVLAAFEGRPGDASAQFDRALSFGVAPPNWQALIQAMYGALLAGQSAQADAAGEAAYRWFVDTGSYGYLALFPEIVPAEDEIAQTS